VADKQDEVFDREPSADLYRVVAVVGTAAAALSLLRLSAHGFAPGGHLPTSTVALFTVGIVLVSVHPTGGRRRRVVHGVSTSEPLEGTSP